MIRRGPNLGIFWVPIIFLFVIFAIIVFSSLITGEDRPRFYDVEPSPGLVCLYDRYLDGGHIVQGSCREVAR